MFDIDGGLDSLIDEGDEGNWVLGCFGGEEGKLKNWEYYFYVFYIKGEYM